MPYVMVPVPEEHVQEVMQFLLRTMARASIEPWDEESIGRLFADVDEPSRSLLSFVARAAVGGGDLAESDAARSVQLSARETNGIMRELNERAREANHPSLLGRRTVPETLPNGRVTQKAVFSMDEEIAKLVRDAERADLLNGSDPLTGRTTTTT
jgi:hypothetical protein